MPIKWLYMWWSRLALVPVPSSTFSPSLKQDHCFHDNQYTSEVWRYDSRMSIQKRTIRSSTYLGAEKLQKNKTLCYHWSSLYFSLVFSLTRVQPNTLVWQLNLQTEYCFSEHLEKSNVLRSADWIWVSGESSIWCPIAYRSLSVTNYIEYFKGWYLQLAIY